MKSGQAHRREKGPGQARRANDRIRERLDLLSRITTVFEKEVLVMLYFLVFTFIAGGFDGVPLQAILFVIGTALQVYLKLARRLDVWNNFAVFAFYLAGTLADLAAGSGTRVLGNGFLVFVLAVSCISALHERFAPRLGQSYISTVVNIVYSAAVFAAFPFLYSLFLLKKKGISLSDFFDESEHFLVFVGYFTFYMSVLINKQMLALQNGMLVKLCLEENRKATGRRVTGPKSV